MNKIVIDGVEFNAESTRNGKGVAAHALAGESLSVDTIQFQVFDTREAFSPADYDAPLIAADDRVFTASQFGDLEARFPDGTPVYLYSDDVIYGKYYLKKLRKIAANQYSVECCSIIGLLAESKHYGGIYSQAIASVVLADILEGVDYTLDSAIASATLTGYLPISNRRDNLQQVLLAIGGGVTIENDGTMRIAPMSAVSTGAFDTLRCYTGGQVETTNPVLGLQLTEHNYFPGGASDTLFEDGINGEELIEFEEPYHSLVIEGGSILESGANYARISGKGSVVLTGKKYTHVTRVINVGDVSGKSTDSVKTVSQAYLANPQVAQDIAERLFAVVTKTKTIKQDVVLGTERAGDVVSVLNPYTGEMESAIIKSLDITMSATNKAKAELLVGYIPQGVLSGFTSHAFLTGSGKWTVPADVTKIRLIVVGAGGGGSGGKNGSEGGDGSWSRGTGSSYDGAGGDATGGSGGAGGAAGKSGAGGLVFEISLDVTPGQVFNFSCGIGGNGGAANGGAGTEGGVTTFGVYSSAYGRKYPYGYAEPKTGLTFAQEGAAGFAGGKGGTASSDSSDQYDDERSYGEDGESVNGFAGGDGAPNRTNYSGPDDRNSDWHSGGGGGGAANGAAGKDADDDGDGGAGATGVAGANATNYGQGGGAGNGGGGGGGGGVRTTHSAVGSNPVYFSVRQGGSAGKGTAGGNGGAGAIIIYY